jgi:WD40 repeat protein
MLLRDARTGEIVQEHTMPHAGRVWSIAGWAKTRVVATVHMDGAVRLWDTNTGTLLLEPGRHPTMAIGAAWLDEGKTLITADTDGLIVRWDVSAEMGR